MKGLDRLMMLYAIAGAMHDDNNKMYNRHKPEPTLEKKSVMPKGQKYVYTDGFECYALNQKNADRKHDNWKT